MTLKKLIASVLLIFTFLTGTTAQDTSHLRISLLTCSPGDELYSIFGHSAIRIADSVKGSDIVYNYGTFDFDDPHFYTKFARGKLLYYVSAEYFADFRDIYKSTNRGMTDQLLDLNGEEKKQFQLALNENLKEENKFYKYDFFFDNCTTRLRDFILKFKHPAPVLPAVLPLTKTFRNAIHQYLNNGRQYWSKLAIDLLLGARTDRVMTAAEQQFLPDNLMLALDKTDPRVVLVKKQLYAFNPPEVIDPVFTPFVVFLSVLLIYLALYFSYNKKILDLLIRLDGFLYFVIGLLGCILLFMWFGTVHIMTKNNYNLLWALPTHAFAAFFVQSRKKWVRYYFLYTGILMLLLTLSWFFLPQQMNPAFLPVVLLLLFRSFRFYVRNSDGTIPNMERQ